MNTNDKLTSTLDQFDLTIAEYALLNLISYEQRTPSLAPQHASGLLEPHSRRIAWSDFEFALDRLHRRQLIVTVDADVQHRVASFLRDQRCHGPTDGIPLLGTLDYTLKGAVFFRSVLNFRHDDMPVDYYWSSCIAYVYRRSATLVYLVSDQLGDSFCLDNLIPVGKFEPIGPWRVQWWRLNPMGYRLTCRPVPGFQ